MSADIELLDAWCAGDNAAGDALIRRHFEAVCRFFRSKLGEDVEDLIQRTFQVCTVRRNDLTAGGSFRGFLFGVLSQDEATVLGAHIRPLAVEGGGVMALPEDLQ